MKRSRLRYVLFVLACLCLLRGTAVETSARFMLMRGVDVNIYTIVCDPNTDDPTGYRFYDNDVLIGEAADLTAPSVIWSIAADDYQLHNIAVTAYRRSEDGNILESPPTIVSFQQAAFAPPESSPNNGPANYGAFNYGAFSSAPSSSPDATEVPTNASQIVDTSGAVWTIGEALTIQRNGTWVAGGLGSEILWTGGAIYVLGVDGNWWLWAGNGWVNIGPTQP